MTIAIGLLAKNGLVLAADTQVTHGSHKLNQSKMLIANRPNRSGAMAISGAGWGRYLDSVNREICALFMKTKTAKTSPNLTGVLKAQVKQFHYDHVAPLSASRDQPNFALVVGACVGGKSRLWLSEESTLSPGFSYGAVGVGAAYASEMLTRYWDKDLSLEAAASLAVYVVFKVKETVDGCGDQTQVVLLRNNHASYMAQPNVGLLEGIFQDHTADGNAMLHFVLGLPSQDTNLLAKFTGNLEDNRKRLADVQRSHITLSRAIRPLEEPEFRSGEDD